MKQPRDIISNITVYPTILESSRKKLRGLRKLRLFGVFSEFEFDVRNVVIFLSFFWLDATARLTTISRFPEIGYNASFSSKFSVTYFLESSSLDIFNEKNIRRKHHTFPFCRSYQRLQPSFCKVEREFHEAAR